MKSVDIIFVNGQDFLSVSLRKASFKNTYIKSTKNKRELPIFI